MKFELAKNFLKAGYKIKKPCWQEGSYWYLGGLGIILWTDGTPAKIHLRQLESEDWRIYYETKKLEPPKELLREIDEVTTKHLKEFSEQIRKDFYKIKRKYEEKIKHADYWGKKLSK